MGSPDDVRDTIETLRAEIREHDHRYYVLADPVISDRDYDQLLARLREIEDAHPDLITADSPTQRVGGEPIDGFVHVRHAAAMQSIDNTYDESQLREFDSRVARGLGTGDYRYVLDPKIDGVAVSLRYEKGLLTQAATRGDGTIGDDVTHTIRTIPAIPLRLKSNDLPEVLEVRGEVYWPTEAFHRFNEQRAADGEPLFANPRNATAGSLKQLDPQKIAGRGLSFIAHGVGMIEPLRFDTHTDLFDAFARWGIPVSHHQTLVENIDAAIDVVQHWQTKRTDLPYETDGMVIKINRFDQRESLGSTARYPRWCIAFKFAAEQAQSVLLDVDFQVGKLGAITPVARLTPVRLAGTIVSNASLHNPVQIERLDLHDGDTVIVEKAGEIIPQVVGVVLDQRRPSAKRIEVPTRCPACDAPAQRDRPDPGMVAFRCENADCPDGFKVIQRKTARKTCVRCDGPVKVVDELPTLRCVNPACPAQLKARLAYFASRSAMDIEGLGDTLVESLVDQKLLANITDIYRLYHHKSELVEMDGLGEKSVDNMLAGIESSKTRPLSKLLAALNIPHVGTATAELLAERFGSIDALLAAEPSDIHEAITTAESSTGDATKKVPTAVADFFADSNTRRIVEDLRAAGVNMTQPTIAHGGPLEGKTVVVTGTLTNFTRSQIQARIKALGGKTASTVTKKTDLVLVGESAGSKADKARQLGIETIDEATFTARFGVDVV